MTPVKIVGTVPPVQWYVLDDDTVVSFYIAYTDKERSPEKAIIFSSDKDTWASLAAKQLNIKSTFIRNAFPIEAETYIQENNLTIKKVIEI